MKKKEYLVTAFLITVIVLSIFPIKMKIESDREKEQQLEDTVDSYFRLYDTGRMTIKDIDFALDSFNEKDRNYIRTKLIEKGVPLDNEKK